MKKLLISSSLVLAILLSGCLGSTQATLYFLSEQARPDAKKIGCEEYLVPIKKNFSGKIMVDEIVKTLLNEDPKKYGDDLTTATAFIEKYIQYESSIDPEKPTASDPIRVRLITASQGGIAGVCDVPRIKEQMTETVRAYASQKGGPFQITLNGSVRNWECLGDESGNCK